MRDRETLRFKICDLLYNRNLRARLINDRDSLEWIAKFAKTYQGRIPREYIDKLNRIADDIDWLISGK